MVSEVPSLEPEGNVDQADHDRHFHQGTDHRGKGRPGIEAEDRHGHGDGEFKVVAGSRKSQGSGFAVVGPDLPAHPERHKKHHHEVDQERDGDAHHVQGNLDDEVAFETEHDDDGKKQGNQGDGADLGNHHGMIALPPHDLDAYKAGQRPGDEGNAEIDEDALGDLADSDGNHRPFKTEERRQHTDEEPGIDAEEDDLEDAVKGDQTGGVLRIPLGQIVPDDDHGDAAR